MEGIIALFVILPIFAFVMVFSVFAAFRLYEKLFEETSLYESLKRRKKMKKEITSKMDECHQYGLCAGGDKPTFACKTCPMKESK